MFEGCQRRSLTLNIRLIALTLVAALALTTAAPLASAHASKTSDDGKIKVTWGWTDEPATTEAKNGLDLILRYADNNTGVMGAHNSDLKVEIHYGSDVLKLDAIKPQHGKEAEGRYTGPHPITPSKSGLYTLKIKGTLEGSPIDLEIPANHEVEAIEHTYFPEKAGHGETPSGGDDSALEARIAALEQKVAALEAEAKTQSEQTPTPTTQTGAGATDAGKGIPGLGIGLVIGALGMVAIALSMRRRN